MSLQNCKTITLEYPAECRAEESPLIDPSACGGKHTKTEIDESQRPGSPHIDKWRIETLAFLHFEAAEQFAGRLIMEAGRLLNGKRFDVVFCGNRWTGRVRPE